jgi:DnaJ-class molecular chaperone
MDYYSNEYVTISAAALELDIARPYLSKMANEGIEDGAIRSDYRGKLYVRFDDLVDYLVMRGNKKATAYRQAAKDAHDSSHQQHNYHDPFEDFFNWVDSKMNALDHAFAVLGIQPTANMTTIKKAYHAAAVANHPDLGGSTAAMQDVNAAYDYIMKSGVH